MSGAWTASCVGAAAAAATVGGFVPWRPRAVRRLADPENGVRAPHPERSNQARPPGWRGAKVAIASVVACLVAPPLAALPPAVVWTRARMTVAHRRRLRERHVAEGLPDAVDLLLLCTEAGWSLPVAHPRVAARLPAPVGAALRAADEAAARGQPRSEALVDALSPLGDRARALGHVLADHLHYGVALSPGLDRLGLELRLDRRRRAELEARRVPVRLLGPLVACILPAFALLTVVPLLAASLRALPT